MIDEPNKNLTVEIAQIDVQILEMCYAHRLRSILWPIRGMHPKYLNGDILLHKHFAVWDTKTKLAKHVEKRGVISDLEPFVFHVIDYTSLCHFYCVNQL